MPRTRPRPRLVPVTPTADRPPVVDMLEDLGCELEKIQVLTELFVNGVTEGQALVVVCCIQDTLERATRLRRRALETVLGQALAFADPTIHPTACWPDGGGA